MSDKPTYTPSEDAHSGPIKNPKQLLATVFFAFILPIFIIVGLVSFVVSGTKPSGSAQGDDMALYGVSQKSRAQDIQMRLAKVGEVEIRDANRPLAAGEVVFKAQCVACHGKPGIPAAPHFGDAAAWAPRIGQGYATLLTHALKGKGIMPPQGGGDYEDLEIGRAVVYMANEGGAKFPIPERPAAGDAAAAAGADEKPAADALTGTAGTAGVAADAKGTPEAVAATAAENAPGAAKPVAGPMPAPPVTPTAPVAADPMGAGPTTAPTAAQAPAQPPAAPEAAPADAPTSK